MTQDIKSLAPTALWEHFYNLTQIPRPSKHEEKVRQYVCERAAASGLGYTVDKVGNVIIRKPASPGMEDRKGVILQAHLDMVPQANSGIRHNFETDPIRPVVDGDWVKADGTTLGSDNGIGVAAALTILESKTLAHPPLEVFFTIDEETGMTGVFGAEPGMLSGNILLNLDSEDEGELYIGCAGGLDLNIDFPFTQEPPHPDTAAYELHLSGLKGGHSGIDIIRQRGNANKLMARLLYEIQSETNMQLWSFNGGDMKNAIPRECRAVILIENPHKERFENIVRNFEQTIHAEFSFADPDMCVTISPTKQPFWVMSHDWLHRILRLLLACPHGVARMSDAAPGTVETSNNMGIVAINDGKVHINCHVRSLVDSAKHALAQNIKGIFELVFADIKIGAEYPGWKPNPDSGILQVMKSVHEKLWNKTPEVKVIHAGLECGIIAGIYPALDMISFGPTIRFPHSPDEKVNIGSVERFWQWLTATLAHIN